MSSKTQFSEKELKDCFEAIDTDQSGFIECKEIERALRELGATGQDLVDLTKVSFLPMVRNIFIKSRQNI